VALILLLGAGLWFCWPAGVYRSRAPERLPEPGAAYVQVVLAGNPLMHRPDRLTHDGSKGGGPAAAFPLLPPAPTPALPAPPPYTAVAAEPPSLPVARANRFAPPPLVASPPLEPLPVRPARREQRMRLSAGLREARFRFTTPASVTGGVGRVRYQVLLGSDGRVVVLLDDLPSEGSASLAWRRALLRGAGVTNASGFVEAEW
jgi:hypothetical protein